MSRTSTANVALVLGSHYVSGSSPDLQAFIDTASLIVSRVNTCATTKGVTLSTEELEMIERYLAAHYFSHADQLYQSKSTNGASGSFQGQTGKGIESSQYGMTALQLDPSGCLNAITKGARASVTWGGKPTSTQLSAYERGNTR